MQIASKTLDTKVEMEKLCLLSGRHRVYSHVCDSFGADSMTKRLLNSFVDDAGSVDGTGPFLTRAFPWIKPEERRTIRTAR